MIIWVNCSFREEVLLDCDSQSMDRQSKQELRSFLFFAESLRNLLRKTLSFVGQGYDEGVVA